MGSFLLFRAALIGYAGGSALYHFILWLTDRRERLLLAFAGRCAATAVLAFALMKLSTTADVAAVQRLATLRITAGACAVICTAWTVALLAGVRMRPFLWLVTAGVGATAVVNTFVRPLLTVLAVDRVALPWGELIFVPRSVPSALLWPAFAVSAGVGVFGVWCAAQLWRRDRIGATLLIFGTVVETLSVVAALLVDGHGARLPYLGGVPDIFWVSLLALQIARDHRRSSARLEAAEARVEEEVAGHRTAEGALVAARAQLRTLFESAHDAIFLMDGSRFVHCNGRTPAMFGCGLDEIIGRTPLEFSPERQPDGAPSRRRSEALVAEAMAGRPVLFEWRHHRKDGTPFDAEVSLGPVNVDGTPYVLAIVRDVSARNESEHARRRLEARLHHAQKLESVGRLAGGVAHDFNNMLTVVNGFGDLLLERLKGDDDRRYVEAIRQAGERGAELTRRLLVVGQKQVTQPRPARLSAIVTEVAQLAATLLPADVSVETRFDTTSDVIHADPAQVQHVLMNLIINARDAMPTGGRILVATDATSLRADEIDAGDDAGLRGGMYVRLRVTDTGLGMDAETRAHLFEPFFTTKGQTLGTGLGLATAYAIVRQSGGFIRVESEPAVGTSFTLYWPASAAAVDERDATSRATQPAGTPGSETVLVAEDEELVRALTTESLRGLGYHVIAGANGAEALAAAASHGGRIDLLVTDVMMPVMNGNDLAEQLRVLSPGIKVLFVSGYSDEVIGEPGMTSQKRSYLAKPFTPAQLGARVRDVLDGATATILVVDDDEEIRSLFEAILAPRYTVLQASNGKEAIERVRRHPEIAVMITDLVMPEQDGLESIPAIRAMRPDLGVIAMSGAFGGQFLKVAKRFGADAVLQKPVTREALRGAIDQVLDAPRACAA